MPAYCTKDTPLTYQIDYYEHVSHAEETAHKLAVAPPMLFHGGHDHTFSSSVGPHAARGRGGQPAPGQSLLIGPEEAARRTEAVREWTRLAHDAGARRVVPYVCNQTIFGDPAARTVFWEFWDRWIEYEDGLGPRPEADPSLWMQRDPNGLPHHNYPLRFSEQEPRLRHAPCPNNPHWHSWLKTCARLMARDGYDGVFIDNNIVHCHCEHCQREFHAYLTETYSPSELIERYGTADVSNLRLSVAGDKVQWAWAQPEYVRRVHDEDPEHFRRLFATDDPDQAVPSEGGNGLHWWKSHCYWLDTLRSSHTGEEVAAILRSADVSSLGITTPRERCLWADTQKFWASSVSRRNAEIRQAGREHCPGFVTIPNFGALTGPNAVNSRRLEGKNPRLWGEGASIMMYEEDLFPGTLAPGYTLDHVISYKYACACGVRACVLPSRDAGHRALCELAIAEAATWSGDGMFVQVNQPEYLFPDIRKAYREFFERHADLYRNKTSVAHVGVVYSFDELHMENMHHLLEVYPIARYLTDNHVLFDFLNEAQITREELARFDVVIVPHVMFLPRASRTALMDYAAGGGKLVLTGNTGAFDEHGRPTGADDTLERMRRETWAAGARATFTRSGDSSIVWIDDIREWLPKKRCQVHELADMRWDELAERVVPELQREAPTEDPTRQCFARLLDELAGYRLSALADETPYTLRVAAWEDVDGRSVVLHLVNYDAPGPTLPETGRVVPVEDVRISLPLRAGRAPSRAWLMDPWHPDPAEMACRTESNRFETAIPKVDTYAVLRLEYP